jgi:hypothetical protein
MASATDLRAAVAANPVWYHSIELAPGLVTPGHIDLRPVARRVLPERMEGRALDVGTFDGFWAFELERRGAPDFTWWRPNLATLRAWLRTAGFAPEGRPHLRRALRTNQMVSAAPAAMRPTTTATPSASCAKLNPSASRSASTSQPGVCRHSWMCDTLPGTGRPPGGYCSPATGACAASPSAPVPPAPRLPGAAEQKRGPGVGLSAGHFAQASGREGRGYLIGLGDQEA